MYTLYYDPDEFYVRSSERNDWCQHLMGSVDFRNFIVFLWAETLAH